MKKPKKKYVEKVVEQKITEKPVRRINYF